MLPENMELEKKKPTSFAFKFLFVAQNDFELLILLSHPPQGLGL